MSQRLLIVDDDESLRDSLSMVLGAEGFDVATAADGERALAQLDIVAPDIILCDLRMPDRKSVV